MRTSWIGPALAAFLASPCAAGAQSDRKGWLGGDYGRVIGCAMESSGERPPGGKVKMFASRAPSTYVYRARLISLNAGRTANVCFDTEHLRWACAWTGGYVAWKGATKDMGPWIRGDVQFGTGGGPGWARGGSFVDPRTPREGPLPKDWAHYKGLYVHGDRVILSYTVGETEVLEMPGAVESDGRTAFTRSFAMGPRSRPHSLRVLDTKRDSADVRGAKAKAGDLEAAVVGAPPGAAWSLADGRLVLTLPESADTSLFRVVVTKGAVDGFLEGDPEDVRAFTKGGPARWTRAVETAVRPGPEDAAYTVDTIGVPGKNPWNSWIRFTGLDFFEDGRAALCTWDGDVWIVSGLDGTRASWRRFAAGLHQPVGLKIVDGTIYTAGRDQITRLRDLNGDGEADFYGNFNNDAALTYQRHEFVLDLETDDSGNFYYGRSGHYISSEKGDNCCVFRVSKDGGTLEVFARNLREPTGLTFGPGGIATVTESTGSRRSPIYPLRKGAVYDYRPPHSPFKDLGAPTPAIVWIPHKVDRCPGGEAWATTGRWGPLDGTMAHTSYGHSALFYLLLDEGSNPLQGAVVRLPLVFQSGLLRARFSPADGQLYVAGLRGWDTNAARDAAFQRVRYTGKPAGLPVRWRVTGSGVEMTFSEPLDPGTAGDADRYAAIRGGKEPRAREVASAVLKPDGKTVALEVGDFGPMEEFEVRFRIKAADGTPVAGTVYATINALPR